MGESTLPSSCWVASTIASTINALVNPSVTSAISTANAPATTAPTIGMKPATNVISASVNAIGTPTIAMPVPMMIASTREHTACARMNPDRVFQARVSSSVRYRPVRPPVAERSHGRKRWPSLRKKKVSTNSTISVTDSPAAVLMPENTPPAIAPAWFWIHRWISLTPSLRFSGSMFSGGPCAHSCRR